MSSLLSRISWPLVVALGSFALVRPLLSITGVSDAVGRPVTPIVATIAITVVWVAATVATRQAEPFWTLVLTGVAYAVLSTVLSGILSPVLDGELAGPLAFPPAVLFVVLTNAAWGAAAGWIALTISGRRAAEPR